MKDLSGLCTLSAHPTIGGFRKFWFLREIEALAPGLLDLGGDFGLVG
jgi:hypothetical protein